MLTCTVSILETPVANLELPSLSIVILLILYHLTILIDILLNCDASTVVTNRVHHLADAVRTAISIAHALYAVHPISQGMVTIHVLV